MRTDPPTGDELTSMLTTMKADVLRRAGQSDAPSPARRTRGRALGVGISLVALLLVGSAGAALAAGVIPSPFGDPAPTIVTPTSTSAVTPTPTVPTETPDPPRPTPPPAPDVDPEDPSTWTIRFDGVGPVQLGSSFDEQRQVLSTFEDFTDALCTAGNLDLQAPSGFRFRFVGGPDEPMATAAITFGNGGSPLADDRATTPKTAAGIGIDSTKDELLAAYPDIELTGMYQSEIYPYYGITDGNGGWIVFALIDDEVSTIQIANESVLPNENRSVKTMPSERCPA